MYSCNMKGCFLFLFILLASCTHRNMTHVTLALSSACDSIHISYYKDIQPVIRNNCYACHATAVTTNGGLDLEDTSTLKAYLNYDFRGDGLYGSKLYHCLLHSLNAQQMPPTYLLDSCSLHQIHHWISLGAPIH